MFILIEYRVRTPLTTRFHTYTLIHYTVTEHLRSMIYQEVQPLGDRQRHPPLIYLFLMMLLM